MKVPHDEELANRISPESCGCYGNIMAEALTGENAGGLLSSEITAFRVPTLWLDGEGNTLHSDTRELWTDPAESGNLACVEASCARIGRLVNHPVFKNWNGGIQKRKISRCVELRPLSAQAKNTNAGRKYRVGWGRSKFVRPLHNVSRESDNNIVPEKQANNVAANMSLGRSLWRKGR